MRPEPPPTVPATAVDLEIRVTTRWEHGVRHLDYEVDSPSGVANHFHTKIPGPTVHHPERFQKELMAQLEALHKGRDVDGGHVLREEVLRELKTIGNDLYQQLFPRELRGIYREVAPKTRTLLISSDEPWIPWELLHPHEIDGDDFLCLRFEMSRWLNGEVPLAAGKTVRRVLCVEAGGGRSLPEAAGESAFFEDLARRTPGLRPSRHQSPTFQDLVGLLEGASYDLLHLTGHGEHDHLRPGEAKILGEDRALRARHLSPEAERKLRSERPVVFFNTCSVGRLSLGLTAVDGWAERWVRRCGCSAFLAPLWWVKDSSGARFSQLVYEHLYAGHPLGRAVLLARRTLREEKPGDLAWLAYSLYGAPNARIIFGEHAPETSPLRPQLPLTPTATATSTSPSPHWIEDRTSDPQAVLANGPVLPKIPKRALRNTAVTLALALATLLIWQPWDGNQPAQPNAGTTVLAPPTDPESGPGPAETKPEEEKPNGGEPGTVSTTTVDPSTGAQTIVLPPQQPPKTAFPLSPPVSGKIGIIVLDRETRRPDRSVADAVRAALSASGAPVTTLVPSLSDALAESLLAGDFSSLPDDGRAPWGAEYLLLATATRKNLPQSSPNLESYSLTLDAQLIATRDKTQAARAYETHTGISVSGGEALTQAAERCLKSITETLNGGSRDGDSG